jgi:hypothetical protein
MKNWDPFRRPDATWTEAGEIVQSGRRCPRRADEALKQAIKLRRQLTGNRRAKPSQEAIQAHKMYVENGPVRWELVARMVSGESTEEISRRLGIPVRIIELFAGIFCDILDRLRALGHLAKHLVQHAHIVGFQEHQVREFWAWVAMSGETKILDSVIESYHSCCQPGGPRGLSVYLESDLGISRRLQAFLALHSLPATGPGAFALCTIGQQFDMIEQIEDPFVREFEHERVQREVIRLARKHLKKAPITEAEVSKSARRTEKKFGAAQKRKEIRQKCSQSVRNLVALGAPKRHDSPESLRCDLRDLVTTYEVRLTI